MTSSGAAPLVDHAAQLRKESRPSLNLVEDHQVIAMRFEERGRVIELAGILGRFEVEVGRCRQGAGEFERERGLADLAWGRGWRRPETRRSVVRETVWIGGKSSLQSSTAQKNCNVRRRAPCPAEMPSTPACGRAHRRAVVGRRQVPITPPSLRRITTVADLGRPPGL